MAIKQRNTGSQKKAKMSLELQPGNSAGYSMTWKMNSKNLAEKNNLLISGGSDFHGDNRKVSLGDGGITEKEFFILKDFHHQNYL